jgi:hypothetical protein
MYINNIHYDCMVNENNKYVKILIYNSIVNMSFPENRERTSINEVKGTFKSVFDQLNNNFNSRLNEYRRINDMNERTNRALVTGQKLLRNVSLKNGDLSNDIKKQIGDLDTKDRKIELTETDIKLNQNIIEILYTILIGVAISIVIMIVSYFMKWDNGISQSSVTSSTSNSDSLLDKVGSLFKFNSNGNNYKGNLLSTDSGISGSLFKIGGNKK